MRVLVDVLPGYGHLHPHVALLRALVQAGDEVLVTTSPSFAAAVSSFGLDVRGAGPNWTEPCVGDTFPEIRGVGGREWGVLLGEIIAGRVAPHLVDEVSAVAGEWKADLIIGEWLEAFVSARCRVPWVRIVIGMPRPQLPGIGGPPPGRGGGPEYEALVARDGASPEPMATLDTCPPSLHFAHDARAFYPRSHPIRPVPPVGIPEPAPGTRVWITLGTVVSDPDLYARAIEAARSEGFAVTVAAGRDAAALSPRFGGDPGVTILGHVPVAELYTDCLAVIHHGGWSSTVDALWHGIPALSLPQIAEQPANAIRLTAAGAGCLLWPSETSTDRIAAALRALTTDPVYASNARRLRDEMLAMPTPEDVVPVLRDAAAGVPFEPPPLLPPIRLAPREV